MRNFGESLNLPCEHLSNLEQTGGGNVGGKDYSDEALDRNKDQVIGQ